MLIKKYAQQHILLHIKLLKKNGCPKLGHPFYICTTYYLVRDMLRILSTITC